MGIITSGVPTALQMFSRRLRVAGKGYKKYQGSAESICRQVVKDCWNGTYFQGSAGHFSQFWVRDFCFSAPALVQLGYKEQVKKTLDWALGIFQHNKKITTTIFVYTEPANVFTDSAESLPYVINTCFRFAPELLTKYRTFLAEQINDYFIEYVDNKTGLIRHDISFSGMKDAFNRESACSDNCMVAMMAKDLKQIKVLPNPFRDFNYKKLIKEKFWTGDFFKDDLSEDVYLATDANILPFSTGIFTDKTMLKKIIKEIQKQKLDKPFPVKYSADHIYWKQRAVSNLFTPNYEGDTVWMNIGALYISQVAKVNKRLAREYLNQYTRLINKTKNYLELFDPDGSVYKTAFYHSDEGMIWAAIYLKLRRDLK